MATTTDYPTPLIHYLRVQQDMDLEVQTILQRAAEDAEKALLALQGDGVGDSIRRAQVRQAQAEINRSLREAMADTGSAIRSNSSKAAEAAVQANMDPFIRLFEQAGMGGQQIDSMLRSQKATAARGVTNAKTRVTLSRIPLSEQVYKTGVLASGQLDRIVTSGIARGVSRQELAAAVKDFIRPDTPGGVRYAADRLARTELNNAFHGTSVQEGIKSPFITAMRWNLSGSHPRPDECNDYESGGDLEDGLWSPERVPGKPHPNCLCFVSPETPSREEFLKQFQAGTYNDFLEENGATPVPVTSARATPTGKTFKPANYDRLPSSVKGSADEVRALRNYQGTGYRRINDDLRAGRIGDPDVSRIDSVMERSEITEDIVVWRGQGHGELFKEMGLKLNDKGRSEFGRYVDAIESNPEGHGVMADWDITPLVGKTWSSPSYLSTSVRDAKFEAQAFSSKNVQFRINAPKGTRGTTFGDTDGEREFLVDRGYDYTITRAEVDDKGKLIIDLLLNPKKRSK